MDDKSCVNEIFDKNKSSSYVSDLNKINAEKIKTTIQLLVQKIASLENLVNSKDKTINSLTSDFNTIRSDFEQLQSDHDRLKGESMSRFTKYDAFQKLTSDNFKILDTEKMVYQMVKTKTNEELKRLSKESTNLKKNSARQVQAKHTGVQSKTKEGVTLGLAKHVGDRSRQMTLR